MNLRTRSIVGNVTVAGPSGLQAWYRLEPVGWEYRPEAEREARILAFAQGLARLTGRSLHLRVTSRPWSVAQWARAHHEEAPEPLNPASWADHLIACQRAMASRRLSNKEVYLGVTLRSPLAARMFAGAAGLGLGSRTHAAVHRLHAEELAEIDDVMSSPAIAANPCTPRELEWLIRRSVGLGLPPPSALTGVAHDNWAEDEMEALGTDAVWDPAPFGRTVRITAVGDDGQERERHVCTLAIGQMADMTIPQIDDPWLQRLDRLRFPVEVSARIDVLTDEAVRAQMRHAIQKIRAQKHHYVVEHEEPPPPQLDRQAAKALLVEDELASGLAGLATRTRTWVRIAVSGRDAAEALRRTKEVERVYGTKVSVHRMIDQYQSARSFIPGEPPDSGAYCRRMPVTTLAASMPQATADWGDRHGIPLGSTSGTTQTAAFLSFWDAPENNESGLCVISAGLGGGKSTLGGWAVYAAAMSGIPMTVLDPSGRMQQLANISELAGQVRVVDLLEGADGVLSPYHVIADPRPQFYPDPADFERRRRQAKADRKELAQSVLTQILPTALAEHELTELALMEACGRVTPTASASLYLVVEQLERLDDLKDRQLAEHARRIARFLRETATTAAGRLLFPAGYLRDPLRKQDESRPPMITVYSLRGLQLPDDNASSRETNRAETRLALCLLSSAAWLMTRDMYLGHPDQRKGILMDEARVLRRVHTGRALMEATAADSRKHNTVVFLLDQLVSALADLNLPNLASMAFIGRLTSHTEQQAALKFLKIEQDKGYEQVFATLSPPQHQFKDYPREFVARDWRGNVERLRIDFSQSHPHVLAALNTTSASHRLHQKTQEPPPEASVYPEHQVSLIKEQPTLVGVEP